MLCLFGGSLALYDIFGKWPSDLKEAEDAGDSWRAFSVLCAFVSPAFATFLRYIGVGLQSDYAVHVYATAVDMTMGIILVLFCASHIRLVLRNTTTIEPKNFRYDMGYKANFQQHFGRRAAAWLLPIQAKDTGDGIHWTSKSDQA